MDCCEEHSDHQDNKKINGGKMDKKTIMWVVIGVLFLVALYLIFQLGSGSIAAQSVAPATKPAVSSSGMVGGC